MTESSLLPWPWLHHTKTHFLFFTWTLKCISHSMLLNRFGLLPLSPETFLHQIRPMWYGVFLQRCNTFAVLIISVVCADDQWIASLWLNNNNKKRASQHTCCLLCVSCPRRELCCSLWCSSAPQLWKCLFIQDAVARPAGCSLTAFWQSHITSSWALDNHPLSRTLSYLSRLEALQFYHAHAVFLFFFFFFPGRLAFSSHVLFIYHLYTEFPMTSSVSAGFLKTGWIICCGSPRPDR